MAKWCKVKVKEFAIGFGPTIWKKQGKETKYAIRLIPIGGFVNMVGEAHREDKEGSFSTTKIHKRIAIIVAGAVINILFIIPALLKEPSSSERSSSPNIFTNPPKGINLSAYFV